MESKSRSQKSRGIYKVTSCHGKMLESLLRGKHVVSVCNRGGIESVYYQQCMLSRKVSGQDTNGKRRSCQSARRRLVGTQPLSWFICRGFLSREANILMKLISGFLARYCNFFSSLYRIYSSHNQQILHI
jgi:hypothetical protein